MIVEQIKFWKVLAFWEGVGMREKMESTSYFCYTHLTWLILLNLITWLNNINKHPKSINMRWAWVKLCILLLFFSLKTLWLGISAATTNAIIWRRLKAPKFNRIDGRCLPTLGSPMFSFCILQSPFVAI